MAIKYTKRDEPVPGFRLIEFLGRGGFGEVWKATAPGGAEVAIKIIALDQRQGMKEFKSLRLVKTVRHPNLVPINAFWLKDSSDNLLDDEQIDAAAQAATVPPESHADNQVRGTMLASAAFNRGRPAELIIAMGLGEMNLFSRLQACQADGRDGIPPDELLEYMDGAARAVDFLNSRHNIQHCDIKPQNIMIVGGLAQVCDFGLARELTDTRKTAGAGTMAYGAPELLWENKASAGTDQYSLAITFYELRTGRLPFPEDSAQMAVMMAHREGKLDLTALSEDERAVIKRATSPDPTKRFAHCADMVRALRRAWGGASQLRSSTWIEDRGEGIAIVEKERRPDGALAGDRGGMMVLEILTGPEAGKKTWIRLGQTVKIGEPKRLIWRCRTIRRCPVCISRLSISRMAAAFGTSRAATAPSSMAKRSTRRWSRMETRFRRARAGSESNSNDVPPQANLKARYPRQYAQHFAPLRQTTLTRAILLPMFPACQQKTSGLILQRRSAGL